MRYNTRRAADAIIRGEAFTTNGNLYGVELAGGLAIYSYAEPIAFFDSEKKRTHLNTYTYSNTTSRHQTQTRIAATRLEAEGWDTDVWNPEDFEEVTKLSTKNRNIYYRW